MRPTQNQTAATEGTATAPARAAAKWVQKPAILWRRRSSRSTAFVGPVVAAVAVASFAVTSITTTAPATASLASSTSRPRTVHAAKASGVGTVVVNAVGRTLYRFGPDMQKRVTCTGTCAHFWPPLYVTGKATAGPGIKASLLGTVKAPNGKTQVTYNHWPLYTFSGDSKAGQANGQGLTAFGGTWFALDTSGKRADSATARAKTIHAAKASGVGTVVVNAVGRTLYRFGPDMQKRVTCTGTCAHFWPPLYVTGKATAGPGIKASLLGTVKAPNGKTQVTYNHWPLYTFSGDSKAGQANGQGLTAFGGTWFALDTSGTRAAAPAPPPASSTTTTTLYYP